MTIKELNDRWLSIQELRDEIDERISEGDCIIVLDEFRFQCNSEIRRLHEDLVKAGLNPFLAKTISTSVSKYDC